MGGHDGSSSGTGTGRARAVRNRIRDLDNPTASFPIRPMTSPRAGGPPTPSEDDVSTQPRMRRPRFPDDEDDPEVTTRADRAFRGRSSGDAPTTRLEIDVRWLAVYLLVASGLAMLTAAAIAALAVLNG